MSKGSTIKQISLLIIGLMSFYTLTSCGKKSPMEDYGANLEEVLSYTTKTSDQKESVMEVYETLGGYDASVERASEVCEQLKSGVDIKDIQEQQSAKLADELGIPLADFFTAEGIEASQSAIALAIAEVNAGQQTFCPEMDVEVEIEISP